MDRTELEAFHQEVFFQEVFRQEVFKTAFNRAKEEREKGCPLLAIVLFRAILRTPGLSFEDMLETQNALGLTYFHAGSKYYGEAVKTFELVDTLSRGKGDGYDGYRAVAFRNLARPQFIGYGDIKDIHDCDVNIYNARQIAKEHRRKDLVWFTHGMVSLRIYEG
jgi:hypothetical protein